MFFWWKIHWRTAQAAWQVLGPRGGTLVYALRRPLAMGAMRVALVLDHVFFPGFRRVKVNRPVFIIGHPRSGTTFLQLLLTRTGEYCSFAAWEVFLPSLLVRAALRPLIRRRIHAQQATFLPPEVGHEVALDQVEEDELLLLYTGNTEVVTTVSPLPFGDWDFSELVYADEQPAPLRRRTTRFLRSCYQRQIYSSGKRQVVGKLTYSGMRLQSILAEFPDARVVYIVRSPIETIASYLSFERKLFAYMWGPVEIAPARWQRYYRRRYRTIVDYYRYVEDVVRSRPECMAVSYDDLRRNLSPTVDKIAEFAGLALSPALRECIAEQERRQGAYRPRHANLDLAEFGLTEARVREDLAVVFERYGFER